MMPRRNKSPYWLEQAIDLRKRGDSLTQIANIILQPVSTIRYQLNLNLSQDEYDALCQPSNPPESAERTARIRELHEEGINGNQIANVVGVSRQYVYKLIRMWREQEDAELDRIVEKTNLTLTINEWSKNYAK
tara:strand:+ start:3493 stop:3891 length:399 start_codon:yes stop_codon:yes gene_type:complete